MSLFSWEKEFYPNPVTEVDDLEEAIKHSIRKWQGLLPENLNKHHVFLKQNSKGLITVHDVSDCDAFYIDCSTCALCYLDTQHILNSELYLQEESGCKSCPLYFSSGEKTCYSSASPFDVFITTHNPREMLQELHKCLVWYKKHKYIFDWED